MSEISISKIVIKIGKKEIELSPEEAKELQNVLQETLGKNNTVYIPKPYPVYPNPNPYPYHIPYWTVTVGDSSVIYSTGQA